MFYVRAPKIYIAVNHGQVIAIEKNTLTAIDKFATKVDSLGATPFSDWGIRDDTLYLDGLMIVELLSWLREQYPNATVATFGKRFTDLFREGDASFLPDTIKAVIRVTSGRSVDATGEDAAFVAAQWRDHPREFGDLLLAYLSR